jgi:peptidoglycan lytic transglycosylase G
MRKRWWFAVAVAVSLGLAGGLAAFGAWRLLTSPMSLPADGTVVEIAPGTPLAAFAGELGNRGVLSQPRVLTWYARLSGDATRIQAGEYRLAPDTSPLDMLDMLIAGNVVLHSFTVVEGWRYEDLRAALRKHPAVISVDLTADELMAEIGMPGVHPEGQFLPDTYFFPKGTTDLQLLRWAHEALTNVLEQAWASRAQDGILETPYAALILASIIEKETALPEERVLISGVFHARLARGMRLQTDPTVIYGLGADFDGNLRRRDLSRDTAYNTYTRGGLPPTPIALPGAAAIDAALHPQLTGALYFVATGEPDGSHRFSATIEEHNEAVAEYLRRLREGRR